MHSMSRLEILLNYGFDEDPFNDHCLKTGDCLRVERLVKMAIRSRSMISIVGERGNGKSRAVKAALRGQGVMTVNVRSADKPRVLIADIEQAIILDLSEEHPKRNKEIRARQLRRVLGEASRKQPIAVLIEEGHRLHGQTLRALKTLRELDWMGKTELFSVILVGQSDPMNKAGVAEVRLRSDAIFMHGMTAEEAKAYVKATVGSAFTEEAVEVVSGMSQARNFLDLQDILIKLMGQALISGNERVTPDDVTALFGKKEVVKPKPAAKKKTAATSKPDPGAALSSVLDERNGKKPERRLREVG